MPGHADVAVPDLRIVEEAGEIDIALLEEVLAVGDAPQPHAGRRTPGGEVGLIVQVEAHALGRLDRGYGLVDEATVERQLEGLQHDPGVDAADIGLPALVGLGDILDHRKVAHVIEDRPLVPEVARRLDAVVDGIEEKLARLLVAGDGQVGEIEHGVVEVPAVNGVRVLVLADVGQVAAQRLQFLVVEPLDPRHDLAHQRVLEALPPAPVVKCRSNGQLDHDVGIFTCGIWVEIDMAEMFDTRFGCVHQVLYGRLCA
ncbi:hypothetical protein NJ75_01899 [Novosphingobium subterraneum]|uniref:Uncharacterized protein n=1 Tax=Novosphingobium subterraneum TaxID=48936 RepID=A0A0B8ZU65_9SPHN|nr:hypothetical protein NJ75_01899 [Novosphingobium subterraneum]